MPKTPLQLITVVPQQSVAFTTVLVDIANGMMFLNDGSSLIYISNPGAGPCVVTILAVPDEAGRTGTEPTVGQPATLPTGYAVEVAAGATRIFGPFRQAWWNQTLVDVGYVYITFVQTIPAAQIAIINY
jgi:hypothetical protein